jgi:protein-L-isoaspartate O-methyltransferase
MKIARLRRSLCLPQDLLVTVSMASQLQAPTNKSLASQLSTLLSLKQSTHKALSDLDRARFTSSSNPYSNRPHAISCNQVMTDAFSQAVVMDRLAAFLEERGRRQSVRIVEIGCGHGYLSFAF